MSSRSTVLASLVIVVIVFGAVGGLLYVTNPYEPSRVAVVVMDPGFGDLSIADQVAAGMSEVLRDVSATYFIPPRDFPLPSTAIEAQEVIRNLAGQLGYYDLIIAIGDEMASAVSTVAADFPNQQFALVGGTVTGRTNVVSASFAAEEAAFLAGTLAALVADDDEYSGIVGVLAAVSTDSGIDALVNGFRQGVSRAIDDHSLNVTLLDTQYIGAYNNTATASTMIQTLLSPTGLDASIVFTPVRASMLGIRQGLVILNETYVAAFGNDRVPLVIGAEHNVDYLGLPDPEISSGDSWVITSVVPGTDLSLYDIVNATLWNEFPRGEHFIYNLANSGVNITNLEHSLTFLNRYIPDSVETMMSYQPLIINGTIEVTP